MKRKYVKVTKCYLVQVVDENGYELACEYVFDNKAEAEVRGKEMKKQIEESEGK